MKSFPSLRAPRGALSPMPSLGAYLVVVMLVATVPLALMVAYQLFGDLRAQQRLQGENLQRSAAALAASVERELSTSVDALTKLSRTLALAPDDRLNALESALNAHPRQPNWRSVHLRGPAERDAPAATAPGVAASATISDLLSDEGRLGTVVEVPLVVASGVRYTLGAWIDSAHWQRLVDSGGSPDGGDLSIAGRDRRLIARSGAPALAGQSLAGAAAEGGSTPDVQRIALPEGGFAYRAWQSSLPSGWGISARVFAQPIEAAQRRAVLAVIASTTACLLLGVALAALLARRVTDPLRQLATSGPALQKPPLVREIAQLRDALAAAQEQEARSRAHLQHKADEFQALFASTPIGLAYMPDAPSGIVLHNAAMNELIGPPPGSEAPVGLSRSEAPVGRSSTDAPAAVQAFERGRALPAAEEPLHRAAASGQPVGPLELELRSAGGATRHVLARAVPLPAFDQRTRGAVAAMVEITDRKLAERERAVLIAGEQEARLQAESANRAKDEFLAMLGHELRNPLGAIASAVEVLNSVNADTELAANARLIIGRQTRHLAHLMDDLLDVGRVVSGKVLLCKTRVELGGLIQRVVANFEVTGESKRHDLRLSLARAWAEVDATRIEQVATNLLGNAFKYTPPGRRIEVSLSSRDGRALLEVRDQGPGIPAALLPRVFDLFVQGQRSIDRPEGGLGIGLTLVRRLVEMHGGEVTAHSSPAGTTFQVSLPTVEAPPELGRRLERAAQPPRRVLVVEDNGDVLSAMRAMLELDGHVVSAAVDGERGLALLLSELPDIGIIDIGLPGLSGYQVAQHSRRGGYAGKLFALSGYGGVHDVAEARRHGFDAHLAKPVDPQLLRELLAQP